MDKNTHSHRYTEYTLVNLYRKKHLQRPKCFHGQLTPTGHLQTQILESTRIPHPIKTTASIKVRKIALIIISLLKMTRKCEIYVVQSY